MIASCARASDHRLGFSNFVDFKGLVIRFSFFFFFGFKGSITCLFDVGFVLFVVFFANCSFLFRVLITETP